MTQIIQSLAEISSRYDALFVDLWGCLHNGVTAYPDAVEAMLTYRADGGTVVLVTNSPKSHVGVAGQLKVFGVPESAYDAIATSGDSARAAMFRGAVGERVYVMGDWDSDKGFFEPMSVIEDPVDIRSVPLDEATGIVCIGPFDPMADPAVNRPDFLYAKQLGMKLLCANPDIVVDRGERREWCAGALARLYTEMGGTSLYFGKPHPPIYDLAHRRLAALEKDTSDLQILAIGDGIGTDIAGAMGENIDSLFITGGLAASETNGEDGIDAAKLEAFLAREQASPTYTIDQLR